MVIWVLSKPNPQIVYVVTLLCYYNNIYVNDIEFVCLFHMPLIKQYCRAMAQCV